jgi:hypothetical protein
MSKCPYTPKRAEYLKVYGKKYREDHPEKCEKWKVNSYINQLRKRGYTVIPPKED